jgi:hypothetical protein
MSLEWLTVPVLASDSDVIWVLFAIAGFFMVTVVIIVKSVIKHRERMAKIGMGLDPDYDPDDPHAPLPRRPHDPTSQVGGPG